MSVTSTIKTAVTTAPTTQTAMAALVGGAVTTVLQLLQTYVHGFHAPSAATVALAVAWLTVVASHLTAAASSSASSSSGPPAATPPAAPAADTSTALLS